jgi:hypothetical protein
VRYKDLVANESGDGQLVEHLLDASEHAIIVLEQHFPLMIVTTGPNV